MSSNVAPKWIILAVACGLLGGIVGCSNSNSKKIAELQAELDVLNEDHRKLRKRMATQEEITKAAQMTADTVIALAVGEDSAVNHMTLEEAMDQVERLKRVGEHSEIIRKEFSDRLVQLKKDFVSEFDLPRDYEGMPIPPEDQKLLLPETVNSWRDMAKYWKAKYLSELE